MENFGGPPQSDLLQSAGREVASDFSDKSQGDAVAKEFGLLDDKGNPLTEQANKERDEMKSAQAEKLKGILDKASEPIPAPKPPSEGDKAQPKSAMQDFMDPSTDTPEGALSRAVLGGVANAVQSVANAGIQVANWVENNIGDGKLIPDNYQLDFAEKLIPSSPHIENRVIRAASQFLLPFGMATKGLKALGMAEGAYKTAAVAGAATDFLAFEGHDGNLVNFAQDVTGMSIPIANYFAVKKDDPELLARVKNAATGLGVGVAVEGVAHGIQFIKNVRDAREALKMHDLVASEPRKFAQAPEMQNISPREAITPQETTQFVGKPNTETRLTNLQEEAKTLTDNLAEKNKDVFQDAIVSTSYSEVSSLPPMDMNKILKMSHEEIRANPHAQKSLQVHAEAWGNIAAKEARNIVSGNVDEKSLAAWLQAEEYARELIWRDSKMGAEAAQILGLRAAKVPEDLLPEAYKNVIDLNGGPAQVMHDAQIMSDLSDIERRTVRQKSMFMSVGDALTAVRAGNLLGRPSTWLKNDAGNWLKLADYNITKALAPYFSASKSKGGYSLSELKAWIGLGAEQPSVTAEGLNKLFVQKAALEKVDTSMMHFEELEKHKHKINRVDNHIRDAVMSKVLPGEAMVGMQAQAHALMDQTYTHLLALGDMARGTVKLAAKNEEALKNLSKRGVNGKNMLELGKEFDSAGGTKTDLLGDQGNIENLSQLPVIGPVFENAAPILRAAGKAQMFGPHFLNARDNSMKLLSYTGEVYSLSWRAAKMRGLEGEAFTQAFAEGVRNTPLWVGNISSKSNEMGVATKAAFENTFTEPLTGIAQKMYEFLRTGETGDGKWIDHLGPVMSFTAKTVVPFIKTYINIDSSALRHTILAPLTGKYNAAVRAGGAEAQMARAQLAYGQLGIMALAGALKDSDITGFGPHDPGSRGRWMKEGNKPYTVTIAGKGPIELDAFGNMAPALKVIADIFEIVPHIGGDVSVDEASELGGVFAWMIANHFSPEMLTQGVGQFMEAFHTGEMGPWMANQAVTMIPGTTQAEVINKAAFDQTVRSTKANPVKAPGESTLADNLSLTNNDAISRHFTALQLLINNIKAKIPGLSGTLPPDKNMWAHDRLYPRGIGRQATAPLFGSTINTDDHVTKELFRLGYNGAVEVEDPDELGNPLKLGMPSDTFTKQIDRFKISIKLTPEERNQLIEYSAGEKIDDDTMTLKEALSETMKSDSYKNDTDEAKRVSIKEVVKEYRKMGRNMLYEKNTAVQTRFEEAYQRYIRSLTKEGMAQ